MDGIISDEKCFLFLGSWGKLRFVGICKKAIATKILINQIIFHKSIEEKFHNFLDFFLLFFLAFLWIRVTNIKMTYLRFWLIKKRKNSSNFWCWRRTKKVAFFCHFVLLSPLQPLASCATNFTKKSTPPTRLLALKMNYHKIWICIEKWFNFHLVFNHFDPVPLLFLD